MSNIDKRALREAAVRAGGVKWQYMRATQHSKAYITDDKGSTVINCTDGDVPAKCAGFLESANPDTVLALLDELEAKDSTIATQQQEIRTLLNALGQSSEKRNSDLPDQKRIIGWRASDYTDETSDPELAKNWAAAIGVLPIFEGENQHPDDTLYVRGDAVADNRPELPDGWVACSERMPDIGTEIFYFCQDDGLRGCGIVSSSNFSGKGDAELYVHAEGYDLHFGVDISHWMPLPAAPQQEVK